MASVAAAPANASNVAFETHSSTSRVTREGRRISYNLTVIQQPARARACGSGAKSSTDRRPVDPPPIVQLQIYEGDGPNRSDITSPYNANFFLYATLENARPIAQCRGGQAPGPTNTPVLTGTPVAGISYLDRPDKAGYFIFPDLSVRHEGKYRLSFTLFEDTKEDKDKDPIDRSADYDAASNAVTQAFRRLEVKSTVLDVYSAKKFPGLAESTSLSRLVADQGCRVRIRRDVRMRRRESKNNKDWDDYEDETAKDRIASNATPDPYGASNMPTPQPKMEAMERPRSASVASYSMPPQRRASLQDIGNQYHQSGQVTPQPSPGASHAGFASQSPYYTQPPYAQQQYNPPQPPHQYASYGYNAQMSQHYPYMPQQHPSPLYEQPASQSRQDGLGNGTSATSYPYHANIPTSGPTGGEDHSHGRPSSSQQNISNPTHHLPPTPTIPSSSGYAASGANALPPLKTLQPMPDTFEQTSAMSPLGQCNSVASKRSYGSAFDTRHIDQPLRAGARPDPSPNDFAANGSEDSSDDDSLDLDTFRMSYRRADGTQMSRPLPNY